MITDPAAHGVWVCPLERRGGESRRSGYVQDQVPGGLWVENFAPTPMRFDSHSEKRAYMKRHGIIEHVKHVGSPGSDKNPHTQRFV